MVCFIINKYSIYYQCCIIFISIATYDKLVIEVEKNKTIIDNWFIVGTQYVYMYIHKNICTR
jgi:hypothetical protein